MEPLPWIIEVEEKYNKLFPSGLTQEEIEEANSEIWKNAYPSLDMLEEETHANNT